MTDDAESRARNAARDAANGFLRFERDLNRMLRAMADLPRSVQRKALAQGCDSPERRRALETILTRLEGADEPDGSRHERRPR